MQAYEGYFENGRFYSKGSVIKFPERKKTIINVLDETTENSKSIESALVNTEQKRQARWERIRELRGIVKLTPEQMKKTDKELIAEAMWEKYESIN